VVDDVPLVFEELVVVVDALVEVNIADVFELDVFEADVADDAEDAPGMHWEYQSFVF